MLTSSRLDLYPLTRDDALALWAGHEVRPSVDDYPCENTRAGAMSVLAAHEAQLVVPGFGMYQVVLRRSGLVVGDAGFHAAPHDGEVELGYGLAPSEHGHGYATEAVAVLTHWALNQDGVTRVLANTSTDNVASQKVLEHNAFRLISTDGARLGYAKN